MNYTDFEWINLSSTSYVKYCDFSTNEVASSSLESKFAKLLYMNRKTNNQQWVQALLANPGTTDLVSMLGTNEL